MAEPPPALQATTANQANVPPEAEALGVFVNPATFATPVGNDALEQFVKQKMAPEALAKRVKFDLANVDEQPDPLRILKQHRHWRLMSEYCARKLSGMAPTLGNVDDISKLWRHRIEALIGMRAYQDAETELAKLGDLTRAELHWSGYPAAGRTGLMMQDLILCSPYLKLHRGEFMLAIDDFYRAIHTAGGSGSIREQAMHGVLRAAYELKDYHLAVDVAQDILLGSSHDIVRIGDVARLHLRVGRQRSSAKHRRLTLGHQFGDLAQAEKLVTQMEVELAKRGVNVEQAEAILFHRGLLLVAKGKYEDAMLTWQTLNKLYPQNAAAVNNIAVCHVFLGNIQKATEVLHRTTTGMLPSNLITGAQPGYFNEPIVLNLASLYDLTSTMNVQKKTQLAVEMSSIAGDGVQMDCFKL
ncbi:hypothetical protein RI367_008245 [Sorochytrium milnesiophthora]